MRERQATASFFGSPIHRYNDFREYISYLLFIFCKTECRRFRVKGGGASSRSVLIITIKFGIRVSDGYEFSPCPRLVPPKSPVWPSCRVATEARLAKSCNLSGPTFALILTAASLGKSPSRWVASGWLDSTVLQCQRLERGKLRREQILSSGWWPPTWNEFKKGYI